MYKAKFLKNMKSNSNGIDEDFIFEKDKEYEILLQDSEFIFVKQPNSPKDKKWATQFIGECEGKYFEIIEK